MYFSQQEYNLRCEWGPQGVNTLAPNSDAVVIVDVLSFSTCVDIAVGNGATVYPYRLRDESAQAYADSLQAILASFHRMADGYSLAPSSLVKITAGTRLVLPSPNGSTLSLATGDAPTFAGCLRNARAVATAAQKLGTHISVIPAGERWKEDGTLRPALEDAIGAGAIIHYLPGTRSPEAQAAEVLFLRFKDDLLTCLQSCGSGKELVDRGFPNDVVLAAALDVSTCAPRLVEGAYT